MDKKFLIIIGAVIAVFTVGLYFFKGTGQEIDELTVMFMPSKSKEEILTAAEPMKDILKANMKKQGYTVDKVNLKVADSYDEAKEAVTNGTADVAFMSSASYAQTDSSNAELILTATRQGISVDSEEANDWNKEKTSYEKNVATFYRGLIAAGPSDYGQELSTKVQKGEKLTLGELSHANWCIQSTGSSAGYVYPSLWIKNNYNETLDGLNHIKTEKDYNEAMSDLAAKKCDIMTMYADARIDYENSWQGKNDIFDDIKIIGVTDPIMNDTIVLAKKSPYYSSNFKSAVKRSFVNLASTKEGLATVKPYMHSGYVSGNQADYQNERDIQQELDIK